MTNFLLHSPQLCVSVFIFLLAVFVLKNNPKSSTNISFSLAAISAALWLFFYFMAFLSSDEKTAFLYFKIGYTFVVFIGIGVYHFVSSYLRLKKEVLTSYFCYVAGIFFAVSLWSSDNFMSSSLISYQWGLYPKAAILQKIYMILFTLVVLRFQILLVRRFRSTYQNNDVGERVKLKFVFSSLLFLSIAAVDFLPNYGINIYPFGYILEAFYSSTMAYAILKHKLLGIDVIIRRTVVFTGLFAFVYGVFTVVTMIGQEFFKRNLGWNQWVAMIPTVIVITFALRPLETFLTNLTEKFLFQKKYDYRDLLRVFTNEILTFLDLQKLTERTVAGLNSIVKLESAAVLLHDKDAKIYKVAAGENIKNKDTVFNDDHTLIRYLKASHKPILRDKAADKMHGDGDVNLAFKALNSQLCLPILFHDEMKGVLCLGMKKSGEDYSQEEMDILGTLANTMGIAILNAQQYQESAITQAHAAQSEKMAVIGTLAAGINHEICNPLGIVRGQCEMFLLNARDGFYKDKAPGEIVEIAQDVMGRVIKETDRATAITKKLSSFAKPSQLMQFEEVSVDKELEEVLGLLGQDLKLNNVTLERGIPPGFPPIRADHKQIQEVLFNIIRNAAQALDKKDVRIEVTGLSENGAAFIKISDNGSGNPKDKINNIFRPFYTTKAPGKGTGLGLFIVKQVVERNSGTISVESEVGVGTTFTLKFPVAAQQPAAA